MLTNAEFYVNYADYSNLIDNMREKLLKAMGKDGKKDYSEQWKMIETLERLQVLFHQMYNEQQIIETDSGKVLIERKRLTDKIIALEKQNEELKNNINF